MSQFDFGVLDPQVVTGTVLAEDLNSWRDSVHSTHLGVARPSYVKQGMLWLDSSSQNLLVLYLYDGVADIAVGTFNTNNHTSSIGGGVQGADITTPDAVALWDSDTGKLLKNGVLITESVTDTTAGRLLQVGATKAQLGADVGSGAINDVFYENAQIVDEDYTITDGKNAMSAGKITVADGVTVTVPDGSTWSIV